jgi:SAM-dependent methyltransferase
MTFTAHNVLLSNGKKTLNDNEILLADTAVWKSIENTLQLFFTGTKDERSKLRVADLGCLEGGYAVEFAKLGFETVGIEAREENIEKCNFVKADLGLANLSFVKDDVRNLANYGKFDIVLCYGLLYHLNDPINFLQIVSDCTNKLLFLNTHFAPERDIRYNLGPLNTYFIGPLQKRTHWFEYTKNFRLSPLCKNEGYRGRWFREWGEKTNKSKIEKLVWASYNNSKSFWLCKKDLTKAMHDVKFDSVFEQFNYTGDIMPDNYTHRFNRAMFVALKH